MNITKISREQAITMARIARDVYRDIKDENKVEHMVEFWEDQGFVETQFDINLKKYKELRKTPMCDLTTDDKHFLFNFIDDFLIGHKCKEDKIWK